MIHETTLTEANLAHLLTTLGAADSPVLLSEKEIAEHFNPEHVGFAVEAAFESPRGWVALQKLYDYKAENLPDHVAETTYFGPDGPHLVLVAPDDPNDDSGGCRACSNLVEVAIERGFGLALWVDGTVVLVIPPQYNLVPPDESPEEYGHVPTWVLAELESLPNLSHFLRDSLNSFILQYRELIASGPPDNQAETKVLMDFALSLINGDKRLFFPFSRLAVLQAFEQAGGDPNGRDHFFHTFNDYFLGLIILSNLGDTLTSLVHLFADNTGTAYLHAWEALWVLTAFFHDPGYLSEKMGAALVLATGVPPASSTPPRELDEVTKERILELWDTIFLLARTTLREIQEELYQAGLVEIDAKFHRGLELAYFDGKTAGHSVMSGLTLITVCKTDPAAKKAEYDKDKARIAAGIAALSMLFHDPSARTKLAKCGVPTITFEKLPYASVLMFADCLQDDRRDITTSTFPANGVLKSLAVDVDTRTVDASVDLRSKPPRSLPWIISEFESVLQWLSPSQVTFTIEYRNDASLRW